MNSIAIKHKVHPPSMFGWYIRPRKHRRYLFWLLALSLVSLLFVMRATAVVGINSQLNYQGKLADSGGTAVVDATYNAKFEGTLIVKGDAGFTSQVNFYDHTYFNQDTGGTITIPAQTTSTQILFVQNYPTAPKVLITPQQKLDGRKIWLSSKSKKGFNVTVEPSSNQDIKLDWMAITTN